MVQARGRKFFRLSVAVGVVVGMLVSLVGAPGFTTGVRAETAPPTVVVAVIDSAINPYHDFFHARGELYGKRTPSSVTPELLKALHIDQAHQLSLTRTGNFEADYQADKTRVWDRVKQRELYWFKGTNIIATSFDPGTRPILPDNADDTHGVGTAAAVLRANPDAVVLFVEGITDDAEAFAFNHKHVDIVTTSYGPIGSIPLPYHINNSYTGVVTNGKLHFGAADNSPSPALQDGTAGPWWSIGIAGFQEETTEGKQILSGSFADFAADFTQTLPYCHDCERGTRSVSGTSFATPRSAGTMSKIVQMARQRQGHTGGIRTVRGVPAMSVGNGKVLTNWHFRRALEEAAYYPTIYDYTAGGGTYDLTSAPVLYPAPWVQVGWGVITPAKEHGVILETLSHLGLRTQPGRNKDNLACQYMTTLIEARRLYWDNLALGSESLGLTKNPYIPCGK
jgi:hypothetical protein